VSTCSKLITSGKRRILVDAKEPSLVPDLLDSLRQEFPGVSVDVYDSAITFASVAMTTDMFSSGGWRILVLWDLVEDDLQHCEQVIGSSGDDALIFIQRKSISKSRLYTSLKAECEILTLEPFDEKTCQSYFAAILKRRGCDYSLDVPEAVINRVGKDVSALKCEAKKLSMFGRPISKADVDRVVRSRTDIRVFDFADAILRKRWSQSCSMALEASEGDLIGLMRVMQTQCLKLYKAAMFKEQGMAPDDVASMLEVPLFVARTKIIPLANQLGKQRILRILDVVNSADELARLSKLPKRLVLESLVIKMLKA